jgi:hypothetical protein
MSVSQAAGQLLEVIRRRREEGEELGEFTLPTRLVTLTRLGLALPVEPSGWLEDGGLEVLTSVVSTGLTEDTLCVGVARVGAEDQVIRTATLRQLGSCDLGPPLHSLVVTGRLHPLEVDMLRLSAAPDALAHLEVEDSSTS